MFSLDKIHAMKQYGGGVKGTEKPAAEDGWLLLMEDLKSRKTVKKSIWYIIINVPFIISPYLATRYFFNQNKNLDIPKTLFLRNNLITYFDSSLLVVSNMYDLKLCY